MTYYLADINDESKRWMGACELPKQLPQRRLQLHPTTVWAAGWVGEPQRERSLRHQIVLSRIDKIAFPTITPEMDYVYFSRWLAAVIARDNVLHLDEWRRSYRKDVVLSSSAPAHTRVDRVHCATRTSHAVISPPTWQDKTTQCTCMRGFHRVTKSVIVVFDMWYRCMQSISTVL